MLPKRSSQIANVQRKIREYIEEEKYIDTAHAQLRSKMRNITLQEALYVLKYGVHEKNKTTYDPIFRSWKYAIRGQTMDKKFVRVIVSFNEEIDRMIIITIINITKTRV